MYYSRKNQKLQLGEKMSYPVLKTHYLDFTVKRQVNSVFPPRKAVTDLMILCVLMFMYLRCQ